MTQERYRALMERLLDELPSMSEADRVEHYEVRSEQRMGLRSEVRARRHEFAVDEPEGWGTDTAPNPAEFALAALGSSLEVTTRMYAAQLGIPAGQISTVLSGDLDLAAFLGKDSAGSAGFDRVRVSLLVDLDGDADAVALQRLEEAVTNSCPMLEVFRSPMAVDLTIEAVSSRGGSEQVS